MSNRPSLRRFGFSLKDRRHLPTRDLAIVRIRDHAALPCAADLTLERLFVLFSEHRPAAASCLESVRSNPPLSSTRPPARRSPYITARTSTQPLCGDYTPPWPVHAVKRKAGVIDQLEHGSDRYHMPLVRLLVFGCILRSFRSQKGNPDSGLNPDTHVPG